MHFNYYNGVIAIAGDDEIEILVKVLKLGINCSPLQNTPQGKKVIELIAQMEEGK